MDTTLKEIWTIINTIFFLLKSQFIIIKFYTTFESSFTLFNIKGLELKFHFLLLTSWFYGRLWIYPPFFPDLDRTYRKNQEEQEKFNRVSVDLRTGSGRNCLFDRRTVTFRQSRDKTSIKKIRWSHSHPLSNINRFYHVMYVCVCIYTLYIHTTYISYVVKPYI